jgi:hypothetical protein
MFANLQVYKFQGYKVTRLQVYNFVNCGDNKFEVVISNLVISKLIISKLIISKLIISKLVISKLVIS